MDVNKLAKAQGAPDEIGKARHIIPSLDYNNFMIFLYAFYSLKIEIV